MKKFIATLGAVVAVLALSVVTARADSWTGWISDSGCGAKGANAGHKSCAIGCVKDKGGKYVFVSSADKSVHAIHNQDAVKEDDIGKEVKVTGSAMSDGALHVESIEPAGKM